MKHGSRWAGLVLLVALFSGVDSPASAATTPDCGAKVYKSPGKAWRCTFADNFSGTTLDTRKWQTLTTAASNLRGTDDCWVGNPSTLAMSNGVLRLTSRRMDNPFTCKMANGTTYESQIASGSVTTHGKFAQAFGRFDIRARFPEVTLPGSQGALWMTPQTNTYGGWPASGEIDIAEFYSLYPDRVVPHIHYLLSSPDAR